MKINLLPSKKTPQPQFSPDSFASLYNGNNKKLAYLADHLVAILAFLIPTSILLVFMNMLGFAPFGDKCLFVSDGISKNLPMFSVMQERMQTEGFSFLSLATTSIDEYFFIFLYYLASPMRLLLLFVPAELSVVLLQLYCVLLAGIGSLCMHYCLTHRHSGHCYSRYDFFVLLFTSAYGMSSYFLTQYNDFMYLECVALFPLLFHAYERMMTQKKPRMFLLLGTFCMICQFYLTTIILLVFLFYTILSENQVFANNLDRFFYYIKNALLLFATGGITAIPGLYIIYRNRIQTSSCPDFSLATGFFSFFSRFLPLNHASYVTTNSYGNNLYCGLFVLCFVLFYFFQKDVPFQRKISSLLLLFFLFCIVNVVPVRYFMYLCSEDNGSFNLLGFLLIFFLLLCSADVLYKIKELPSLLYYTGIAIPIILYFITCNYAKDYSRTSSMSTTLIFLVLYFLYYFFMKRGSIQQSSFYGILLLTTLLELSMNTFILLQDTSLLSSTTEAAVFHESEEKTQKAYSPFSVTFEEDFSLPYGYLATAYDTNSISEKGTEFDRQNELAYLLGAKKQLFTPVDITLSCSTDNKDISFMQYDNNIISLKVEKDSVSAKERQNEITLHITPAASGSLYLYTNDIYFIGDVKKGQVIDYTLSFSTTTNARTNFWIHAAILDASVLDEMTEYAVPQSCKVSDTSLFSETVTINAQHNGLFTYNIPYSPFIKVLVDDKFIETHEAITGATAISLTQGKHTICYQLIYFPAILGIIIFVITWSILILYTYRKDHVHSFQTSPFACFMMHLSNAFCTYCKKHRIALLSFCIPMSILLLACMISNCVPFGGNTFMDRDGFVLTLPLFRQRKYQLETGNLFYSWLCGGGSNIFNSMPNTFLSLWLLLVPYDKLLSIMTILELVKIALCGTSMYFYLTRNQNSIRLHPQDYRVLIFSSAYSLSAYMLNMHSYFLWTNVLILFPLVLLSMDALMLQKKSHWYILLLALSILADYNLSLFICIFLVMWFFTYPFENFMDFMRKGFRFAFSSLLSAAMGFIGFYPIIANLQISPYSEADSAWPTLGFFQSFWDTFKQFFLFSDPIIVCDDNGAINLYCGVFCILLLTISFFLSRKKKGQIVRLLMIVFIFFSSNNNLLTYLWNGMHYQIKVPNRYAFLLIFLIIEAACTAFIRFRKMPRKAFPLWIVSVLVLLAGSIICAEKELSQEAIISTILCLIVFFALIMLILLKPKKKTTYYRTFFCFAILELCIHVCYNFRTIYNAADFSNYYSSISDYIKREYTDDNSLERVGVIGPVTSNAGMFLNQPSYIQFNSYLTKWQFRGGQSYGLSSAHNCIQSNNNMSPFGNAITNTKYIILDEYIYEDYADINGYLPIATYDHTIILENQTILSPAFYLPKSDYSLVAASTNSDAFINTFCDLFTDQGHQYSDQILLLEADKEKSSLQNTNYLTLVTEDDNDPYQVIHFTAPKDGIYYYHADEYYYLGKLIGGKVYEYKIDASVDSGYITRFDRTVFESFFEEASKYTFYTTKRGNSSLEGIMTLPDDGYIHFSIPYEPGWNAYIDGKETDISIFHDGSICISASQGTHNIKLTFFPTAFIPSVLVTASGWLLYLLLFCLKPYFNRDKKEESVVK